MILDPEDPTQALIDSATDREGFVLGPSMLGNVHSSIRCLGRPCVIHNPSNHHMRTWPLLWRDDTRTMERTCPHGTGHPDPDDVAYHLERNPDASFAHSCDGCCSATTFESDPEND